MNIKRKIISATALSIATVILTACSDADNKNSSAVTENSSTISDTSGLSQSNETSAAETLPNATVPEISYSDFDTNAEADGNAVSISLLNDKATCEDNSVKIEGSKITITSEGSYTLSGTLNDGQIIVDTDKNTKVKLIFNNVNITCLNSAPVYIKSADKTVITLVEGTTNVLTDTSTYVFENEADKKPTGCLYSKDDLTINGTGTLTVNGNYNNGIACSNDLKIMSGNISVSAINNGIKGNDSITIADGTISVNSKDDGLKVENEIESHKGYFYMEKGNVTVNASDDGICAITNLIVKSGKLTVTAEDKIVNCDGEIDIAAGVLNNT